MVRAPSDWWPISEGNPVPGDPETLAGLGRHMKNAAIAIASMASQLPKLASSEIWDSDAGDAFREKSSSVAKDIDKAHGRFQAVATALGSSTAGGTGYAATLHEYQEKAYTAADAVTGAEGSEALRLRTWNQLLAANDGQSPDVPPPPGGNKPGVVNRAGADPAGTVYPAATPGSIPPDLPVFRTDSAEVQSLKGTYNGTLATLRSSTTTVNNAAGAIASAAQAAANMIRRVIGSDGLNNPPWWESAWDSVTGYISAHWVGFVSDLSKIAGIISMVCGIIALVLAFIPGLQAVAALFETVALLAQFVATLCDVILFATGHGSWLSVALDAVGLITFGLGGGLISRVGEAAETVGDMAKAFTGAEDLAKVAGQAGDVGAVFEQADAAMGALEVAEDPSFMSGVLKSVKESLDLKSVVTNAIKSLTPAEGTEQFAKLEELKNLGLGGALTKGIKGAVTFDSPEILESLGKMTEDADEMRTVSTVASLTDGPSLFADADQGIVHMNVVAQVVTVAPPVARDIVNFAAADRNIFRIVQATGMASGLYSVVG